MKICIIGCGYVGRSAAIKWKKEGHEITVTTRCLKKASELRKWIDHVYILDGDWQKLLEKQDVVILAVAPDSPADYKLTYLCTAEKLVKALKNTHVSHVIYTGSSSVYGEQGGLWVDEETKPQPTQTNSKILLSTEEILFQATTSYRQICVFRLGEIYGPGRSIVERVKRMLGTACAGTGDNFTNLIYLDEIVSAMTYAKQNKLAGIYNLCDDFHIPRKELYKKISKFYGWPDIQWNPSLQSSFHGNKRVSNRKIKAAGWQINKENSGLRSILL
ncbi:hypothetical protein NEOC84_000947|uniref:SDR family oxidoreductase n=1 Tax=Neochlamydia sp. AcF84 TaxID=2315858 RepID=UPI00140727C1|nr:SDR family oxidoreductase [Neochlamydia sp. AcF84]NGY95039.1 hypothetical protein [Neochlamydia sp. AcF84]